MTRLASLFLLLYCSVQADEIISVQTLNTYGPFYSESLSLRHSRLLDFLKINPSDLTFLQEVWLDRQHEDIKKVSQFMKINSIFYDHHQGSSRSGLATMVRGTIHKIDFRFFPLKNNFYDQIHSFFKINKGFGALYISHPKIPDAPLWVVNTHLHSLDQEVRLIQLVHYLKWFLNKKVLQEPMIMAGDFNFDPQSLEFKIMRNIFYFEEPQAYLDLRYQCTICPENNWSIGYQLSQILFMDYGKTVDYVFLKSSSKIRLTPQNFEIFPKKYNKYFLSDHYGVRTEIKFEDNLDFKQANEESLELRIQRFSKTLNQWQSQLNRSFIEEHEFLNSLHTQLQNPDSVLIYHLKHN